MSDGQFAVTFAKTAAKLHVKPPTPAKHPQRSPCGFTIRSAISSRPTMRRTGFPSQTTIGSGIRADERGLSPDRTRDPGTVVASPVPAPRMVPGPFSTVAIGK